MKQQTSGWRKIDVENTFKKLSTATGCATGCGWIFLIHSHLCLPDEFPIDTFVAD